MERRTFGRKSARWARKLEDGVKSSRINPAQRLHYRKGVTAGAPPINGDSR